MWHLIVKGGWVMLPIFVCSIFSLAIILERIFFYANLRFVKKGLVVQILEYIRKDKITEAIELCEKNSFYTTNILRAGLMHCEESKEGIREAMESASLYEIPKLEKNSHLLSTIAHTAPLFGLLGTATGFAQCFYIIEQQSLRAGSIGPADFGGGIWEALITTIAGLCIAIPTYIASNYFLYRVTLATLEMEQAASEVLELLSRKRYGRET
ncbi:MAG: MotA/TolQ/ExbB proton channel family protein [Candidatus Omnitrophota bacterium]|nr:MotA/TolQ/ExbB proton channel family protein [Candidatus Omnitrophota bacterium]